MWEVFEMMLDPIWNIIKSNPVLSGILLLFIVGSLLLAFTMNMIGLYRLKKSGIEEVDEMPGNRFEKYLQTLLKSKGYHARTTPATGDYGADLILKKQRQTIIVQAKRYKNNVGIKAVQEIASAKSYYHADECWVVTNSHFTESARKLAKSNQVRLIDRTTLMNWMIQVNKSA